MSDTFGGSSVQISGNADSELLEMAVHGRWNVALAADIRAAIDKCLAEHPTALLTDLRDLGDPDGRSAPLWLAAHRAGGLRQPPVRLALCVPPAAVLATRLRRIGAPRFVSMFASMPEARAALAGGLRLPDRVQLILPPEPGSPARARDLVTQACLDWRLAPLRHRAVTVVSELVSNGIEHAATPLRLTVSRRGPGLYLAVHDDDPRLPRLLSPSRHEPGTPVLARGHGLRVVHVAASAWGARNDRGGKVVWATIRDGVRQTEP
ncbi:ATP-binding protein [Couchioplanes azureus]|uniref:ATP-binding protein n=1 Tax=Couchioplanes caeruleus TaxID=56438 RepID=UPI001E3E25B8|nr:ATP-binding protein [Couchioplanes caeruleus]